MFSQCVNQGGLHAAGTGQGFEGVHGVLLGDLAPPVQRHGPRRTNRRGYGDGPG